MKLYGLSFDNIEVIVRIKNEISNEKLTKAVLDFLEHHPEDVIKSRLIDKYRKVQEWKKKGHNISITLRLRCKAYNTSINVEVGILVEDKIVPLSEVDYVCTEELDYFSFNFPAEFNYTYAKKLYDLIQQFRVVEKL